MACGGLRTDLNWRFKQPYFPVLAQGILGKGTFFEAPDQKIALLGCRGPSPRSADPPDCTELKPLSVAVEKLALT